VVSVPADCHHCAENTCCLVGLRTDCLGSLGVDNDLRYLVARMGPSGPTCISTCGLIALRRASDVQRLPGATAVLHLWHRHEFAAPRHQRGSAQAGGQGFEQTKKPQRLFLASAIRLRVDGDQRSLSRLKYTPKNEPAGCDHEPPGVAGHAVGSTRSTRAGESENRTGTEAGITADRSATSFMANFFRLYLHVSALNLLFGPDASSCRLRPPRNWDCRRVADRGDRRTGSQTILQRRRVRASGRDSPAPADTVDQGRREVITARRVSFLGVYFNLDNDR